MNATTTIRLSDLNGGKRHQTSLEGDLTPSHTVGQAVENYLDEVGIPANGLRWNVFSRGVRLDLKERLEDLPETDDDWTVVPEVSAGA